MSAGREAIADDVVLLRGRAVPTAPLREAIATIATVAPQWPVR